MNPTKAGARIGSRSVAIACESYNMAPSGPLSPSRISVNIVYAQNIERGLFRRALADAPGTQLEYALIAELRAGVNVDWIVDISHLMQLM